MGNVRSRLVQIARQIPPAFIGKRSIKYLHELHVGVAMSRQAQPGPAFEQHDLSLRASGNLDLAPFETGAEPAPGADLTVTYRLRKFYSQRRLERGGSRSCDRSARIEIEALERPPERIRGKPRLRHVFEDRSADR